LFVLIQQIQQVNLASVFQVQEAVSESASFSFAAGRIRASRLANPSQALHQVSASRIVEQVGLNRVKDIES
jgi:hypothetical protein